MFQLTTRAILPPDCYWYLSTFGAGNKARTQDWLTQDLSLTLPGVTIVTVSFPVHYEMMCKEALSYAWTIVGYLRAEVADEDAKKCCDQLSFMGPVVLENQDPNLVVLT